MTQKRNYHCDRCRKTILEHRTLLVAEVGMLRVRFPDGFDLCQDCSEQFVNWLRADQEAQLPDESAKAKTELEIPTGPVTRLARRDSKS